MGKKVVICDRPNPLGGEIFEGRCLEDDLKISLGCSEMFQRCFESVLKDFWWPLSDHLSGLLTNLDLFRTNQDHGS